MKNQKTHILIAGWFSFEQMGTTAGDIIAKDIVCKWLFDAGIEYDVAMASVFQNYGGINWESADPAVYTHLIFVCGPFGNGWPVDLMLDRFKNCKLIGLNLSLLQKLNEWNPFDFLYARDGAGAGNPDITFIAPAPVVPVVGIILVHKQKEYGERALHEKANEAIERLTNSREMSIVKIDTALENNKYGLRSPGEVESLIAKMDVVITTRLHGTVLALKNSVPAIPIDPIQHGAKITEQVKSINWPVLFNAENLDDASLIKAFDFCLSPAAKKSANLCAQSARNIIERLHAEMIVRLKNQLH